MVRSLGQRARACRQRQHRDDARRLREKSALHETPSTFEIHASETCAVRIGHIGAWRQKAMGRIAPFPLFTVIYRRMPSFAVPPTGGHATDRQSTRLNSSHLVI